jgi:hypothetical protein
VPFGFSFGLLPQEAITATKPITDLPRSSSMNLGRPSKAGNAVPHLKAGQDLSFITVTIAGKDGLMVSRAKHHWRFEISGPAEIVATDNGDATSHESFQAEERNAYNGLCLVRARPQAGKAGQIKLKAQAEGLASAEISIMGTFIR